MPTHPKSLWRTRLPDVKFALLPPGTTRPNPVVLGNLVIASIFSPGAICAVSRRNGELVWRRPLPYYGCSAVHSAEGILFAKTAKSVYALNCATGEIRWEFTPQKKPGEWIYSQPVVNRGRLFFGDRTGDFHCLDATTGKSLWRRQTSRADNNQVNATALTLGRRVITANNDGVVVCYNALSGKTIWRQRVDGSCTSELLRFGSRVVVGARSLYALDLETGVVRFRVEFPERGVYSVTTVGRRLVAIWGPDLRSLSCSSESQPWDYDLVVIERGHEIAKRPINGIGALRTCIETGLVYLTGPAAMEVVDPASGDSLISRRGDIGLPDVSKGYLYTLDIKGVISSEPLRARSRRPVRPGGRSFP